MKLFDLSTRRTRLGAAICTLLLASQLAACGGGDNDSPATSTPPPTGTTPPPPPPATVSLNLTGKVTDEPIANAQVTATVGSETFTATADANGDYSLEIEILEADADNFVTLSARGVGDQAFVEFKSLAGSFESLATQAGSDGTLSSSENFATQITNVSTAQAVFLAEANQGQPITTDAVLQSLAAALNAQEVLDLAAAIKLAVDDAANNPLPAGQTSILALASDATARQAFIDEVYENNPEAFAAAQTAIAQDPNLVQPLSNDVVAQYIEAGGFTTAMLSTDALFTFNYTGRVDHFDLGAGGVGSVSTDTSEQEMTWAVEGSTIRVTYTTPVQTISFDTKDCNGDVRQYRGEYVSEGATLTFLGPRSVAITTTSDVTYADCPSLDGEQTSTAARTILDLDNFQVIDIEELRDQKQTFYVWDSVQGDVVADVAQINADGTGRALLTGQDFTWTVIEDGKIIQATFAGWSADYLSFRDIDETASDIFWEVRVEGGAVLMGAGASIFIDPAYALDGFAEDEVSNGRYYQFGRGDETSGDPRLDGFSLRFDEGGVGSEEFDYIANDGSVVIDNGDTEPAMQFRYTVVQGPVSTEVVLRKTFDTATSTYNCEWTGLPESTCERFDERRIMSIVSNEREYWMEVRRSGVGLGFIEEDTPYTSLVRFYEYEDLLDQPVVEKPRVGGAGSKARELAKGAVQR